MLDEATLSRLKIELASGEYPGLASVYLFGSEAEGRAHRESDIDLAVLLDPALPGGADARFEVRLRLIGRIEPLLAGRPLDLVILKDCPPLFARRIIWEGRRLLCPRPQIDYAFVRDIQLLAADLEPWLRRMRQLKLAELRRA